MCRIMQQRRRRSGARRLRARGSLCESPPQHGHDHDGDEANDHDGYEGDERVNKRMITNTKKER